MTGNQNIAFHVDPTADLDTVRQELVYAGFPGTSRRERVTCRVCPGSHECLVGLGPTREIAAALVAKLGPAAVKLTWAISGCPDSLRPTAAGRCRHNHFPPLCRRKW